ncbi:uncharacterized protein LOC135163615 [Diachasmimorpha longicaudata]|uniref:uncharacterized protein LOC135163615 n=1 Tax=Diachasmimorpha longicaudata TaxID=58733 RepID=UPI0030B8E852
MNGMSLRCLETRFRRSVPEDQTKNVYPIDYNSSLIYEEESLPCDSLLFLLEFLHAYYIPTIIVLGLVGNLLSCIVFSNTHLKMRSSSYYLAALAITDFTFLNVLLLVWLNSELDWRVFNAHGWCQILVYISAVCSSLSVWLIVAFTVERFIAIQYPLHRPQMCTISRAKTIVCSLIVSSMICHSYALVAAGVVENSQGTPYCDLKHEYMDIMKVISTIDSIASLMVPIILIVVMNTMIMRNLLKFSRRFRQTPMASVIVSNQCNSNDRPDINLNQISSKSSSHNGIALGTMMANRAGSQQSFHSSKNSNSHRSSSASGGPVPTAGTATANITTPAQPSSTTPCHLNYQVPEIGAKCISIGSSSRSVMSTKNQHNITKMLLLISTAFILLNLPSYGIRLCIFFLTLAKQESPALLWCLQQFFMLLYYTNFSINFLLYAMCGVTFRRCLKQLVQKTLTGLTRYIGRQRRNSDIT